MKIGKLVKLYVSTIFEYCEKNNESELSKLMDKGYSKDTFNINFPFCTDISQISPAKSTRYWKDTYQVHGRNVRVCSQWFPKDKKYFKQYLLKHQLVAQAELEAKDNKPESTMKTIDIVRIKKGRYNAKAIGDAQNALIRNILGNLGKESFNKNDWSETKDYFSNACAYCGKLGELQMEHAIPINKNSLGEHRLGNLVPSCKACNSNKSNKDFREFLGANESKISKIEEYMSKKGYTPLEKDNEQIENILEMARQDTLAIANRYITLLNELFIDEK